MTFQKTRVYLRSVLAALLLFIFLGAQAFALPADGVTPVNSRDYVVAVHKLLNNAKTSIRVMAYQTFFYDEFPDSDSNKFLQELIDAKKRGVEVYVFLETSNWNSGLDAKNKDFAKRLGKGGVKVYFDHKEITSHEKVIIVDEYATLIASNNWSHFSLWLNYEVAAIIWSDEVAAAFVDYFNKLMTEAGNDPIKLKKVENIITPKELGYEALPAEDIILATNRKYFPIVQKAFQNAEKKIRVVQRSALYYTMLPPYAEKILKPGEPVSQINILLDELIKARKRDVEVQVILDAEVRKNSKGKWVVNDDNEDFAIRLMAGGVDVYYDDLVTQTHAKMVIVDDQTIVGSTNWTLNAVEQGNEASVLIKSKEVTDVYLKYCDELKSKGVKVESGFSLYSHMQDLKEKDAKKDENSKKEKDEDCKAHKNKDSKEEKNEDSKDEKDDDSNDED